MRKDEFKMWGNRNKNQEAASEGRLARRRKAAFCGSLVALMPLLTGVGAGPASAVRDDDMYYVIDIAGRPVEPYVQIPHELHLGVPASWNEVQQAPRPIRCEVISGVVDPGYVVDGVAVIVSGGKYGNPSKAWAVNPPGTKPEKSVVE